MNYEPCPCTPEEPGFSATIPSGTDETTHHARHLSDPQSETMTQYSALGTNVLLHNGDATSPFADNMVMLSMTVLCKNRDATKTENKNQQKK